MLKIISAALWRASKSIKEHRRESKSIGENQRASAIKFLKSTKECQERCVRR